MSSHDALAVTNTYGWQAWTASWILYRVSWDVGTGQTGISRHVRQWCPQVSRRPSMSKQQQHNTFCLLHLYPSLPSSVPSPVMDPPPRKRKRHDDTPPSDLDSTESTDQVLPRSRCHQSSRQFLKNYVESPCLDEPCRDVAPIGSEGISVHNRAASSDHLSGANSNRSHPGRAPDSATFALFKATGPVMYVQRPCQC